MFAFVLTLTILATVKVAAIFFCFLIGFLAAVFEIDMSDEDITVAKIIKLIFSFVLSLGVAIWGWIIIIF